LKGLSSSKNPSRGYRGFDEEKVWKLSPVTARFTGAKELRVKPQTIGNGGPMCAVPNILNRNPLIWDHLQIAASPPPGLTRVNFLDSGSSWKSVQQFSKAYIAVDASNRAGIKRLGRFYRKMHTGCERT